MTQTTDPDHETPLYRKKLPAVKQRAFCVQETRSVLDDNLLADFNLVGIADVVPAAEIVNGAVVLLCQGTEGVAALDDVILCLGVVTAGC